MIRRTIGLFMCFVAAGAAHTDEALSVSHAGDSEESSTTSAHVDALRGLSKVRLVTVFDSPEAQQLGVHARAMRDGIASRLRESGLSIVANDAENEAIPKLVFFVDVFLDNTPNRPTAGIFLVKVHLVEAVILVRDSRRTVGATYFWRAMGQLPTGRIEEAPRRVDEVMLILVKEFCSQYKRANDQ